MFDNLKALSKDIIELMNSASNARDKVYSPYSKFNISTTILLDNENEEIITGSNQENTSYP